MNSNNAHATNSFQPHTFPGVTPHYQMVESAGTSALLSGTGLIQVETRASKPVTDSSDTVISLPINSADDKKTSGDGITHIRIDIEGETLIGRMLSSYYECNFIHPIFGPFRTMEGLARYINCDDEGTKRTQDFRTVSGRGVKKISETMKKRFVSNFKEIIYDATYFRIINDKELCKLFTESTLPFDYYFYFGDYKILIRGKGAPWIIEMYENLRTMIKNGEKPTSPDFTKLIADLKLQ
ncbi:hypothetical protein [Undibacterium sp. Di24W]|uniref:hypothetical protein n=1 Tax=Undibacterium sp. Di24W TaxID=3413033 RepID=UPI003BF34826